MFQILFLDLSPGETEALMGAERSGEEQMLQMIEQARDTAAKRENGS